MNYDIIKYKDTLNSRFSEPARRLKFISLTMRFFDMTSIKHMLFTSREVRIVKNYARGLEYRPRPWVEGTTWDRGHSFSQYGPTKAGE